MIKNNIGQVENVYSQDGKTNFFEYDFKNNLLTLKKLFAEDYQNVLDWNGNVILQNEEYMTQTTYDALNRPLTITQPDNTVASYAYNKGGLLEQVVHNGTTYISNINYNEKGQRSKISYGNNTQTMYTYNPKNFYLTNIFTKRNNALDSLQNLNFTFDAVGNIVQQKDNAQQTYYYSNQVIAPNAKYTYDPLYRLINATGRELTSLTAPTPNDFTNSIGAPNTAANAMQNYDHIYEFDELGNMQSDNWKDYVYDTNTNRLLKHDPDQTFNDYTYDVHGNMLTMPHLTSMVWDFANRLQSAGNGTFTSYCNYDFGGNRSRKVVVKSNVREERYYIGDYEIYRKYVNGTQTLERSTVHIIDDRDRFAMIETEIGNTPVVRYQYNNHLGSACLELDSTAAIISYEEYHPYGTTSYRSGRTETEVSLKRYKYVGKERDEETGLYYYGARYYAAWLCRFVSVDPLQFEYPQLTSYNYAGNKPITHIDIDGMQATGDKKDPTIIKKDHTDVAPKPMESNIEFLDPSVLQTPKGAVSFTITYEYKFDIPTYSWSRISISITGSKISDYKFDPKGQPGYTINIKVPTLPSGSSRVVNYNNYTYKGANLFGLYNQENWKSPDPTLAQVFFKGLTDGFYIGLASSLEMPKSNKSTTGSTSKTTATSESVTTKTATKVGEDAVGGTVVKIENSPYLTIQKGDKTYHISPSRVKEYLKNPFNPNSRWGDQINFKKYGVPKGSEIIKGAGKGHKRTPTPAELDMFNKYFNIQ